MILQELLGQEVQTACYSHRSRNTGHSHCQPRHRGLRGDSGYGQYCGSDESNRRSVVMILQELLGQEVHPEGQEEDHETVEEETQQGGARRLLVGDRLEETLGLTPALLWLP